MMQMNQILGALASADEKTLDLVGRVLSGKNKTLEAIVNADKKTLDLINDVLTDNITGGGDPDMRTVNATDAAKRLGVSRPTIYRMMDDGKLETISLRGIRRIRLSSIFSLADVDPVKRRMAAM